MPDNVYQTRDAIQDVWGMRTPYKHEWPTRVDARYSEEPDKWVQSACVLCRYAAVRSLFVILKRSVERPLSLTAGLM